MGRAKWAARKTARKNTAQARPGTISIVSGPARHDQAGRAWTATLARSTNLGPARLRFRLDNGPLTAHKLSYTLFSPSTLIFSFLSLNLPSRWLPPASSLFLLSSHAPGLMTGGLPAPPLRPLALCTSSCRPSGLFAPPLQPPRAVASPCRRSQASHGGTGRCRPVVLASPAQQD
jgi:hypothetical protein